MTSCWGVWRLIRTIWMRRYTLSQGYLPYLFYFSISSSSCEFLFSCENNNTLMFIFMKKIFLIVTRITQKNHNMYTLDNISQNIDFMLAIRLVIFACLVNQGEKHFKMISYLFGVDYEIHDRNRSSSFATSKLDQIHSSVFLF